jgi:diketogulonate reductase-like aldo/keto reductase
VRHVVLPPPPFPTHFLYSFARSIGVSNFNDSQLAELLEHANVTPAANQVRPSLLSTRAAMIDRRRRQILLHPYVLERQKATLDFCAKHNIVVEAYSALMSVSLLLSLPVLE